MAMLPLRARQSGAIGAGLHTQSVIFGMVLTLIAATLGYLAHTGGGAGGSQAASAATGVGGANSAGSNGSGVAGEPTGTGGLGGTAGVSVGGATSGGGVSAPGAQGAAGNTTGGGSGSSQVATNASLPHGFYPTRAANAAAKFNPADKSGQLTSGPLGASDQGVTKNTIKLGFLISNTNELSAAGFKAGLAGNQQEIIKAWVDEINRNGGINGRKLTYYTQNFDVLDVNDMQAACKTMTQDQKVFSVLTTGGYDSVAQLCVAKENRTPLISTDPEPAEWYQQAAPYLWGTFMNKDRLAKNQAKWLASSGYLRRTDKVGVIYHDIPNVAPSVEKSLLPSLHANGINPVDVVKLASDSQQALSQIPNAVLDMQRKGVTFVIFEMNLIFKSQFLQQASKQQYHPRFNDSDEYFGCADFTTSAYDANEYDGTQCLGTTLSGIDVKKWKETPFQKFADSVYKHDYPQGYATEGSDASNQEAQAVLNYGLGSELLMWAQAAMHAGTQLTRRLWGQAMQYTGPWLQQGIYCSLSFKPGKFDGTDKLAVVRYYANASGDYDAKKFHLLAPGCFTNYY
jgi:ABC-type branched-subunit amino acid transport system substrate-binding protein